MKTAYSYIRWSSDKQSEGTSEGRQTEGAEQYAKRHGLKLSTDTFRDAAVSAYRGRNLAEGGALRAFLDAVDAKRISRGSYLLIENFDRLTRLPPRKALRLLEDIVERGIVVVTVDDGKQYTEATLDDFTDLLVTVLKIGRGHAENKRRADLVSKSYDERLADGKALGAMCPSWLTLAGVKPQKGQPETREYKLVAEKAKVVRQVFRLAASGLGSPSIARRLNEKHVPTLGSALLWTHGLVSALLKNKAVIGTLVRKKAGKGERPNTYPAVIAQEEFDAVHAMIEGRKVNGRPRGGRPAKGVPNLFTGLLDCEHGHRRVKYVSGAKPHLYVQCEVAYSGGDCDCPRFPYQLVEQEILQWLMFVQGHDFSGTTVLSDPKLPVRMRIEENEATTQNAIAVLAKLRDEDAQDRLARQIDSLAAERRSLERTLADITVPLPLQERAASAFELLKRHDALKAAGSPELDELRETLRTAIRGLIDRVRLMHGTVQTGESHIRAFVIYGDIVDQWKSDGAAPGLYTDDGGLLLEIELPAWGFYNSRRSPDRGRKRRQS